MMKWFLTGVAAINLSVSAFVLAYYPHVYEWTWMLTDVAFVALAVWAWSAEKDYA